MTFQPFYPIVDLFVVETDGGVNVKLEAFETKCSPVSAEMNDMVVVRDFHGRGD